MIKLQSDIYIYNRPIAADVNTRHDVAHVTPSAILVYHMTAQLLTGDRLLIFGTTNLKIYRRSLLVNKDGDLRYCRLFRQLEASSRCWLLSLTGRYNPPRGAGTGAQRKATNPMADVHSSIRHRT